MSVAEHVQRWRTRMGVPGQPPLEINPYVRVVNNPLRWIDPTGLDETITLYPGASGFGHVGGGVNTTSTTGLYPAPQVSDARGVAGQSVPGSLHPDTRQPLTTVTLPTTPEQDRVMQDIINRLLKNPGNYELYDRNCVAAVREVLGAAGIIDFCINNVLSFGQEVSHETCWKPRGTATAAQPSHRAA